MLLRSNTKLLTILILLTSLCSNLAYSAEEFTAAATINELETRLNSILQENDIPGMIGTIVYGDEVIWQQGLGVANTVADRPATDTTLFRVGSISKSFVSLSILKLVERGQLSLDDLISDIAPQAGIENPWEETDPIRLVHVLEHTAGLDDIHFRDFAFSDPNVTTLDGIEFNNGSTHARWRPGTRMAYSNMGPAVAALALENATGESFESFVDREVLSVLGMRTASFMYQEGIAFSYDPAGEVTPYTHIPVRPSGSLNASARDMAQLLKMYNQRGRINGQQLVSAQSLTRMESPSSTLAASHGLETGYGLSNYTSQKNGFVFHGHNGGIDGFISSYAYLSDHGRGYFFSMNKPSGAAIGNIDKEIAAFVTRDLEPPIPEPVVDVSSADLESVAGIYQPDSPRLSLTHGIEKFLFLSVRHDEEKLYIKPFFSEEIELLPVGDKLFRRENNALASTVFLTSEEDGLLMQQGQATFKQISPIAAYGRVAAMVYAIVLQLSALVFAIVWIARKLLGKLSGVHSLAVRAVPAIGSLLFVLLAFVTVSTVSDLDNASSLNFWSGSFWLLSLLFPLCALCAVGIAANSFKLRQEIGLAVWHHSLQVSIALCVFSYFLLEMGLLGLRVWAF